MSAHTSARTPRLTRRALADAGRGVACPPVRMVHMGLGAFHRSHQAWYTDQVSDDWGIAAFTGRRPDVARVLCAQDGLYSLVERGAERDQARVVSTVVQAIAGDDLARFAEQVSAPSTVVLTMTVTEAGYRLGADGALDLQDDAIAADLAALRASAGAPTTALGRLTHALQARRRAKAGPLALVPCDNLPDNGRRVGRALVELAQQAHDGLGAWIEQHVAFVSTSVDRITPRIDADEAARLAGLTGFYDEAVVVAEPFHNWVLSGQFPGGRPPWEHAGARFVDDIEPFERRKLWLLNGAHSLLAYAGPLFGHATVAQAVGDTRMRAWIDALWDEASRHLPGQLLQLEDYRAALVQRFSNPRIRHELQQIADDGLTKLQVRIVPVALAERQHGRDAQATARAVAAWVASWLQRKPLNDVHTKAIKKARDASGDPVFHLVALLSDTLARDADFMRVVGQMLDSLPSTQEPAA